MVMFILIRNSLLMSMIFSIVFISIINDSFHLAREKLNDNPEIFTFMLKKFLRWTGLKQPTELGIQEERDKRMHSKYLNPIDTLPIRVVQLSKAIDRIFKSEKPKTDSNRK